MRSCDGCGFPILSAMRSGRADGGAGKRFCPATTPVLWRVQTLPTNSCLGHTLGDLRSAGTDPGSGNPVLCAPFEKLARTSFSSKPTWHVGARMGRDLVDLCSGAGLH